MPQALTADQVQLLTDIPDIGKPIAQDLMRLGTRTPEQVKVMNPVVSFGALRSPMGQRHDPCVLDTFLAARDFMNGGPSTPWWHFSGRRKALLEVQQRESDKSC